MIEITLACVNLTFVSSIFDGNASQQFVCSILFRARVERTMRAPDCGLRRWDFRLLVVSQFKTGQKLK